MMCITAVFQKNVGNMTRCALICYVLLFGSYGRWLRENEYFKDPSSYCNPLISVFLQLTNVLLKTVIINVLFLSIRQYFYVKHHER